MEQGFYSQKGWGSKLDTEVSFRETQTKVPRSIQIFLNIQILRKSAVCQKMFNNQLLRKKWNLYFDHTFVINCINRRGGWMLSLYSAWLMYHSFPNSCNLRPQLPNAALTGTPVEMCHLWRTWVRSLQRWLRDWDQWLIFWKTQVRFPESKRQITGKCNSSPRETGALPGLCKHHAHTWYTDIHAGKHAHTYKKLKTTPSDFYAQSELFWTLKNNCSEVFIAHNLMATDMTLF